jgi:hypothetical protein
MLNEVSDDDETNEDEEDEEDNVGNRRDVGDDGKEITGDGVREM